MKKITLINADVMTGLATLLDESVQCVVTSPPYWGLRDYGVPEQIGLEPTIEEYVEKMVEVFREVRRVLRKDGTVWLNLGDSFSSGGRTSYDTDKKLTNRGHNFRPGAGRADGKVDQRGQRNRNGVPKGSGLKPKDLCGVPWRVALALQSDGWWLRRDIIWSKPNPMPESCQDRPTTAHEYIFLLTKSAKYFYDQEAVREEVSGTAHARQKKDGSPPSMNFKMQEPGKGNRNNSSFQSYMKDLPTENGRNLRSVWTIATGPFPQAHFATFPPAIPERCIKAGSKENDIILDPFSGAGTTALVAAKLGRDAIGIELSPEYVEMSKKRIVGEMGMLAEVEVK